MQNGVYLRNHRDDSEMLELYTNNGDETIVWGCISAEVLGELVGGITTQDLENCEYELIILKELRL
jgi:hypothetical protein